jgi:hypothetical protein
LRKQGQGCAVRDDMVHAADQIKPLRRVEKLCPAERSLFQCKGRAQFRATDSRSR